MQKKIVMKNYVTVSKFCVSPSSYSHLPTGKDGSIGSSWFCGTINPSTNPGEGEFILTKKDCFPWQGKLVCANLLNSKLRV